MRTIPHFRQTIPCFFDAQWRNPTVGVFGPDPIIAHHLLEGSTYNGNTELPVCMTIYALALANHARVVVETGINNAAGATLWLQLASFCNLGSYTGVDIRQECCDKAVKAGQEMLPDATTRILCGDAMDILPREFAPGSIDLLFVDDAHDRAHVEAELNAFMPLVRSGGWLLFHDILGVHEHDIWDVIAPHGAIKLVDSLFRPDHPFGGLGGIKIP